MSDAATAVFVHGAWHGAWCWERVRARLQERGVASVAVDLPTCDESRGADVVSLSDDATAVRTLIDSIEGPVVVVAHSYGGMVITEAAAGAANVRRLVYLAAFMPDDGETIVPLITSAEPPEVIGALRQTDDGRSFIEPSLAAGVFYGDCDAGTVEWARGRLRSMSNNTADAPKAIAWKDIPATYVVTLDDRAVPPGAQRIMSRHAHEVVEWKTSHSPFASQPALVAEFIERIALESA